MSSSPDTPLNRVSGVLVLGMHRSGTSLTARLLRETGLWAGETEALLPSVESNPDGSGEREDVVALNEWVLKHMAPFPPPEWTGWLYGAPVDPEHLDSAALLHFRSHLEAILRDLEQPGRPWLLKDPRLCLTFPLWAACLDSVHVVLVTRNPASIAHSLRARNHLPFSIGTALWERDIRAAFTSTEQTPRSRIAYEDLLQAPTRTLSGLVEELRHSGFDGLALPSNDELTTRIRPRPIGQGETASAQTELLTPAQRHLFEELAAPRPDISAQPSLGARLALDDFYARREIEGKERTAAVESSEQLLRMRRMDEQTMRTYYGLACDYERCTRELLGSKRWRIGSTLARFADRIRTEPPPPPEETFGSIQRRLQRVGPPRPSGPARRDLKVVALLGSFNEERFIGPCLEHLISHGLEAYLIDNESTDATVEHAQRFLGKGLIGIETLPKKAEFSWTELLEAKLRAADALDGDWFINHDPDEMRLPPSPGKSLLEWIAQVDHEGFNAVNFHELTYVPCVESPNHDHPEFYRTMRWYYPFRTDAVRQMKCWKRQPGPVDLVRSGGHQVDFEGLQRFPISFYFRHYLFLSPEHALRKYGNRVFPQQELDAGWHHWRHRLPADRIRLPRASDLQFDSGPASLNPYPCRQEHVLA